VVVIAKDFNDDLDQYIEKLRGKDSSFKFPSKNSKKTTSMSKPQKMPELLSEEEVYVEYEEPSGFKGWIFGLFGSKNVQKDVEDLPEEVAEELEELEDDVEEIDETIEELEEVREGFITRFLQTMRLARRTQQPLTNDELLEEVVPIMDEDVKEVLKILHRWLEKLPPQELKAFKTSQDFSKYKDILEKYDLIRK
jgi:hypothetical protein